MPAPSASRAIGHRRSSASISHALHRCRSRRRHAFARPAPPRARARSRPRACACARTARVWANVVINPIRNKDGNLMGFAKITRDVNGGCAGAGTGAGRTRRRRWRSASSPPSTISWRHHRQPGGGRARAPGARAPDAFRLARSVENAMRGAQRAPRLTPAAAPPSRRRQPLDPKPVDAERLVIGMSELLRRTLGEQVAIETVLASGLWRVLADPDALRDRHPDRRSSMPQRRQAHH